MVDAPRFTKHLANNIEAMGGLDRIFLTHRDDVCDAHKYAAYFGAERVIHELERAAQPDAEIILGACAVEVLMLGDWRAAAGEVGFWPECGHLARPTLGWKSQTGRPEGKRFAFHTRSMGTARPGASALAGQHLPQHVATVPIRLMFNAKHTRSHSPRTFAKPRRLNRRNPSTSLIHPFGASESHLRCAYRALPAGLASFSPMRCVAGSRAGSTATWDLPSRPQRYVRVDAAIFQLQQIRLVAVARIGQYHRRLDPKRLVDLVELPHQLTLVAGLWPHLSRDDDLVLPIDRHLRVVALLEVPRCWSS